jgi:hypothetical protein
MGSHENHPTAAKLQLFYNHRAAVRHMQRTDEAHPDRTKRP